MAVKIQMGNQIGSDVRPLYAKLEAAPDRARLEETLPGERSEADDQTSREMTAGGLDIETTPDSQIKRVNGEEVILTRSRRAGLAAHDVNFDIDPHLLLWMDRVTQEQLVASIGPLTQGLLSR